MEAPKSCVAGQLLSSRRLTRPLTVATLLFVKVTFQPNGNRILVRRKEAAQTTASGLHIPTTAQDQPIEGEVVAVGPGGRSDTGMLIEIPFNVGDRVVFGKYNGTEVKLDGEPYLVLSADEVLGCIRNAGCEA